MIHSIWETIHSELREAVKDIQVEHIGDHKHFGFPENVYKDGWALKGFGMFGTERVRVD